jgi:hypothetical protein
MRGHHDSFCGRELALVATYLAGCVGRWGSIAARYVLRAAHAPEEDLADCARRLEGHSVEELRALGASPETFRRAGFDATRLQRLIDDSTAAPRARARAAIALGEPARERTRIAAAQTTIPELRVLLERAEDEDVDALESRLEAVDRIV